MGQPVLYLDVDGVLNDEAWLARPERRAAWDAMPGASCDACFAATDIDPARAAIVRRIIEATGCRVVLCSTWQTMPDGLATQALGAVGIAVEGGTLDVYPRRMSDYQWRHRAVAAHVATHAEPWCSLDDQLDRICHPWDGEPNPRCVRPVDGVTETDADLCIAALRTPREVWP